MLIKKARIPIINILLIGFLPSFLKKVIYRLKGYKIGKGVKIGFGSVIIGKNVEIGSQTKIGFMTIIRARNIRIDRYVTIGSLTYMDTESIEIGDDCIIREQVYVGGRIDPESLLRLGKRCTIRQMCFINPTKPIILGDDSTIGGNSLIFTHGSWLSQLEGWPLKFGPIEIGKNVWIPWRTFINPDVKIGDNVLITPNSLITKDIPSNCIATGSPAKVKVKNFLFPLSESERQLTLKTIFSNFADYLTHYHFVSSINNSENGFEMIINKKKKYHQLVFLQNSESVSAKYDDNILILDYDCHIKELQNKFYFKMIISLRNKKRIGTSDIGEEIVKFFSRYGIRFDRED